MDGGWRRWSAMRALLLVGAMLPTLFAHAAAPTAADKAAPSAALDASKSQPPKSQSPKSAAPAPVTTADPDIDLGDLQLLLDPMTKAEVQVEAGGWAKLLRAKVREISDAELAVRRKNREIAALKKVKSAAEQVADVSTKAGKQAVTASVAVGAQDAGAKLAEAKAKLAQSVQAATRAPDTQAPATAASNAQPAAPKAPSDKEVMHRAIDKAQESAAKNGDARAVGDRVTAEVKEDAAERDIAKATKEKPVEGAQAASTPSGAADGTTRNAETIAAKADEAVAAKADTKVQLVDYSTKLATERTAIIDRLKLVLKQLDKLGGDTKEMRAYVAAVSGLKVEVSDYTATLARLKAWLKADEGGLRWARNIAMSLFFIVGSFALAKIARLILERSMAIGSTTSHLLRTFVVAWSGRAVIVAGLLAGLAALEINLAPLLAIIGAAGFVVAFALQGTLSNLASGLLILVNKPFDIDDEVEVGGDIKGRVEAVSIFSTYIVTEDGSRKIVPNNTIWGGVIVNRTTGVVSQAGEDASSEPVAAEK